MTKFILHGGGEGQGGYKHNDFFREIVENLPMSAKVLCVYFAVPDELVAEKHKIYVDFFARNNPEKKEIDLKIASKENFIEELRSCDAVYFRGGETDMLLEKVAKYPYFKSELLRKKIVAGSSAGVYFLCKYGLSSRKNIIYEGLGILPIKSNCHYAKGKNIEKLIPLPGELLLLEEGEYRIIEK